MTGPPPDRPLSTGFLSRLMSRSLCCAVQEDATEHVPQVLSRVKPEYLRRAYKIASWSDHEDFLAQLAQKSGEGAGAGRDTCAGGGCGGGGGRVAQFRSVCCDLVGLQSH